MRIAAGSIVEVTISSRDVPRQCDFLHDAFGFELISAARGPGVVLGVEGVDVGMVRIIEARHDPGLPPPLAWELGPRLLAIRSTDVPATRRRFEKAGGRAGPTVRYDHPGARNEEFVGAGPDDVLWAIAHAVGGPGTVGSARRPSPALESKPGQLNTEVFSVVVNVDELESGRALARAMGWQTLLEIDMDGEQIETALGLPHGARLEFWMGSDPCNLPARLEMMRFSAVPALPRLERTLGIRRVSVPVEGDPGVLLAALPAQRLDHHVLRGPGGLEIEFCGFNRRTSR